MGHGVQGINSEVLRWARKQAGLSVEDAARALRKEPAVLDDWESGAGSPTYIQLERLAYQVYKRPIALFFFPEPPDEPDPTREFRTLPQCASFQLSADTRYAIREAKARQLALAELNDNRNPCARPIFRELRVTPRHSASRSAQFAREHLEVPLSEQLSWSTAEFALQRWRDAVEAKGVFVFKRSFKQREVSGFCLLEEQFPVIYLNNSTAVSRQIFTLFHELAHILLGTNGITSDPLSVFDAPQVSGSRVEVFCNAFAGEVLVPSPDFDTQLPRNPHDDHEIDKLAKRYHVSREVILRKFLERDLIDPDQYAAKARQWNEEYQRQTTSKSTGGNYYATRATYLGRRYLELAFTKYYQGHIGLEELADYLDVKTQNVLGLEPFALGNR